MSEAPAETTNDVEADSAKETDWKAEARKWETRAKENLGRATENEEAAKRLAALEEANKTEAERTAERLAALERENADLKSGKTRAEVAAAKGVPAGLLSGSTQEELEAAADALIAFRGAQTSEDKATLVIPDEGGHPNLALNGDGLESALRKALGIS
ncbi:hypothetical protein [Curtobacterium sp. VKM Ac-1376]|uniref:hypothetical protein n=1 Tax=Curtobacterium sp. VKM Ac-1376 TaxID=123312 RepID=UPI00188A9857|nr:hypothetical protein [Curtobacterium sp. VKM Ac-1376]MBF4613755.1 hypothetical protein [Curtobacterium sp. VKM Ac-1376]